MFNPLTDEEFMAFEAWARYEAEKTPELAEKLKDAVAILLRFKIVGKDES